MRLQRSPLLSAGDRVAGRRWAVRAGHPAGSWEPPHFLTEIQNSRLALPRVDLVVLGLGRVNKSGLQEESRKFPFQACRVIL